MVTRRATSFFKTSMKRSGSRRSDTAVGQDDPDSSGVQAGDDGSVILQDFKLSAGTRYTDGGTFPSKILPLGVRI